MSDDIATENVFPASIVRVLADGFERLDGIDIVFRRPILPVDPTRSMGVYAFDWVPGAMQIGQPDPGLAGYNIRIEVSVKHANQEEGLTLHSVLSKSARSMLYRDSTLRQQLTLSDTSFGVIERVLDFRVLTQRFTTFEQQGTYYYLSYMDVNFRIEQVRL